MIIIIAIFNFSNCPVKLKRNLKLKFRSKFNHGFTNHGYLRSAVWKGLYNFKIKRAQEARYNQFFFQNVQNNKIFEVFKMSKNNSWINVYYRKSKCLQSLDCLFCFWLEIPFLVKFGPKTQNDQFKLKFYTWTNSICRIPWRCSLFLFSTGNNFFGKFDPKIKLSVWAESSH